MIIYLQIFLGGRISFFIYDIIMISISMLAKTLVEKYALNQHANSFKHKYVGM